MNPINFNIYAYLNSYINRFRTVTDKNITVQDLHEALRTLGVKTINGTSLYDKQTLENLVTNKRFINKLRAYFKLPPIERPTPITNPKPVKKVEEPEEDEMEKASQELLKNDEVFYESKCLKIDENDIRKSLERIEEVPFDSDRKMMSTKYKMHGVNHILTKGALDVILDRCISIATKDGVRPITKEDKEKILLQNKKYSEEGLRVLTFAYKESDEQLSVDTEYDYIFLGLVSMIDPPREESKQAVADAISAGIKPIMITGDHKVTATAIAKQIGIFRDGDIAVTGMELDSMSDDELDKTIERISVYARVSPENKIRIVEAWQRKGNIVSMTGDGVNDAPALKKADIGVAMGITGTEVSKDASSMILQDDNFATIIKAVANGRNVFRNIKNSILFLLSGNMAGIFAVLYTSFFALPVPFQAVHLLFINLLTDSLPAIAIGMEMPDKDILRQKPRDPKTGILTKDFTVLMFLQGALIGAVTIIAFYIGLQVNSAVASTMAFATLTLARLFHGFNCRGRESIFELGLFSNIYSVGAFVVGTLLLAFVLFVPFMQPLFSVEVLTGAQVGFIGLLAFIPTVIIQIVKVIYSQIKKTK